MAPRGPADRRARRSTLLERLSFVPVIAVIAVGHQAYEARVSVPISSFVSDIISAWSYAIAAPFSLWPRSCR